MLLHSDVSESFDRERKDVLFWQVLFLRHLHTSKMRFLQTMNLQPFAYQQITPKIASWFNQFGICLSVAAPGFPPPAPAEAAAGGAFASTTTVHYHRRTPRSRPALVSSIAADSPAAPAAAAKNFQEKLPEVKDAENTASDLFRIGAYILGRRQKWLQCIIEMCIILSHRWTSVVDGQRLNNGRSLRRSHSESNLAKICLSQGFPVGNCIWKPRDKENQNENYAGENYYGGLKLSCP